MRKCRTKSAPCKSTGRTSAYDLVRSFETVTITLNGDTHELPGPVTVASLLRTLEIDSRRVAVEVNLSVIKKTAYETLIIGDGDEVEVVNFVGGG